MQISLCRSKACRAVVVYDPSCHEICNQSRPMRCKEQKKRGEGGRGEEEKKRSKDIRRIAGVFIRVLSQKRIRFKSHLLDFLGRSCKRIIKK